MDLHTQLATQSVLQWYFHTQTQLTHSVIHTHAGAVTARLAPTRDGLAALLPWQTSDGWRAEKMKGRKGQRMCVRVCVCVKACWWREKSWVQSSQCQRGSYMGPSRSFPPMQHVSFHKQTTLLWTEERLGAFPVNLSLPSTISSICGFVSVCLEYHEKYCKYRTVRLISVKAFVYQTFINLLYNKANVILLKENL